MCQKCFGEKDVIVKDHDHYTRVMSCLARNCCNLKYQKLFIISIVFHNSSDMSHFMIGSLGRKGQISLLHLKKEKYISRYLKMKLTKFRFIDSGIFGSINVFSRYSKICICITDDAPEGNILDVDLNYPKELNKTNKDLPFCANHLVPEGNIFIFKACTKLPTQVTTAFEMNLYKFSNNAIFEKTMENIRTSQSTYFC